MFNTSPYDHLVEKIIYYMKTIYYLNGKIEVIFESSLDFTESESKIDSEYRKIETYFKDSLDIRELTFEKVAVETVWFQLGQIKHTMEIINENIYYGYFKSYGKKLKGKGTTRRC